MPNRENQHHILGRQPTILRNLAKALRPERTTSVFTENSSICRSISRRVPRPGYPPIWCISADIGGQTLYLLDQLKVASLTFSRLVRRGNCKQWNRLGCSETAW